MSIQTKVNKFKGSSKKVIYSSVAAATLLGVGVAGATTVAVNANPITVSASSNFTQVSVAAYVGGTYTHLNAGYYTEESGTTLSIPAPKVDGYTPNYSTVQLKIDDSGNSTQLTPLMYTKTSGTSTGENTSSSSSSAVNSSNKGSSSESTSNKNSSTSNTSSSKNTSSVAGSTASSTKTSTATTNNSKATTSTSSNQALDTAKANAKKAISSNNSLTAAQKADAKASIDKASNTAGVKAVVAAAKDGKTSKTSGDVQTGVTDGVLPAVAGGVASLLAVLGLAFRKFIF